MHPLTIRAAPKNSPVEAPEAFLDVSNSPYPSPQPVDRKTITIGNCVDHRTYMDFPERLEVVFPGIKFPGDGKIFEWQIYAGRDCVVEAQVFRPAPTPRALDENKAPVHNFELVGYDTLTVPAMGNYTFKIEEASQIHVKMGDAIGFYTETPGCISWSDGGPQTIFRYHKAGHNEIKAFGGFIFIGDGLHRTYSISATGSFQIPDHELMHRTSPSVSPSSTPIIGSRSSTQSPSGSISVTPIQSPSASVTPQQSLSLSASISFSPSVTPTVFSRESECAKGVAFWCASERNMKLCNVTKHTCDVILDALHPVLPSSIPSISGSYTPSTSFSPSLAVSQDYVRPSVTPSMSLAVPPFLEQPAEDGPVGITNCNYCNGGTDWTTGSCLQGQNQSPISIKFEEVTTDTALSLYFSVRYSFTRAQVSWNDYAFVISPKGSNFGMVNIDGINYDAQMAFIRSPSEHQLEGVLSPMEIQIYHQVPGSNPPQVLALSILFEESLDDQQNLMWIYSVPKDKSPFQIVVDMEEYLSDQRPLVFYNGSFTQPPCTEGVTWAVSTKTAKIGYNQLQFLNKFFKDNKAFASGRGNNRVLQSLNGRKVILRANCGMTGSNMECGEAAKPGKNVVT